MKSLFLFFLSTKIWEKVSPKKVVLLEVVRDYLDQFHLLLLPFSSVALWCGYEEFGQGLFLDGQNRRQTSFV